MTGAPIFRLELKLPNRPWPCQDLSHWFPRARAPRVMKLQRANTENSDVDVAGHLRFEITASVVIAQRSSVWDFLSRVDSGSSPDVRLRKI